MPTEFFRQIFGFLKRRWWLFLIVLALIGGGVWWWQQRNQKQEDLEIVRPEVRDLTQTIAFSGYVSADKQVTMRFSAGGKINYIGAKKGDEVKAGQTIVSLDQRSVQKQLEKQLSLYENQRLSFETQMDGYEDRWLDTEESREQRQDQLTLNRSILDVELQSLAIENYRLTAPFAGLVVEAPFEVTGVQVAATDSWLLVDPSTLYFRVLVDEVDIDEVQLGQAVQVSLDARPDEVLHGVVDDVAYQTSNTADGAVFAVKVRFLEPVSINRQRLGMNGEAKLIVAEKQQVLSLPIETLISRDGKNYVQIMVNNETQDQEVSIGLETEDYVEITAGLTTSDQVILP